MPLRPIRPRIALRILPRPARVDEGIHIPEDTRRDVARESVVVAVYKDYKGPLEIGDRVLCPPWPDREIKFQGDQIAMVPEADLQCLVVG